MYQKEMFNNLGGDHIARLTFGNLDSELVQAGIPTSEVSLAFTPTTLAALENTFVEFGNAVAMDHQRESDSTSGVWENSASYMSDYSDDSDDTSNSMDLSAPAGKRARLCDSTMRSGEGSSDSRPPRRLPGPRPSCRDEEMTPEDLERRRRRRERNKLAAAKCRQRRVDQTNELLQETRSLEEESQKLEKEIETLERLKHQLEFVLEAHKPLCRATDAVVIKPVKVEQVNNGMPNAAARPTFLPITSTVAQSVPTTTAANSMLFDFSGLTPLVDPMGLFGSLEGMSPSLALLSPSSL